MNRLSLFCHSYWICLWFILFMNPLICFFGSINKSNKNYKKNKNIKNYFNLLYNNYYKHLYHPDDWFSLWRMNCRLVSYHSFITK